MTSYRKSTVAHLKGDLTHSGMTKNIIDSLAVSLHKLESGGGKSIRIDCGRIRSADINGLQLLYVWMQCAKFRGVDSTLVNLSDCLKQTMHTLGLAHCFIGTNARQEAWV